MAIPGEAGPKSGYPQWVYNTVSRVVDIVPNGHAAFLVKLAAWPTKLIFFTSRKAADDYAKAQGGGVDITGTGLGQTLGTVASAGGAGIGTIGQLIDFIRQPNLWTRVVEIGAGMILVYAALKAIVTPPGQAPVKQTIGDTMKRTGKRVVKTIK